MHLEGISPAGICILFEYLLPHICGHDKEPSAHDVFLNMVRSMQMLTSLNQ